MNRYVLCYYKKGYMRFLSHLDVQRLFRRALYMADVDLAFTNGYNPHAKLNLVQPLSLGFEAERDYFEFETNGPLDPASICARLNEQLPQDVRFLECRETALEKKSLTARTDAASYRVFVGTDDAKRPDVEAFLRRDQVPVTKKDKKTKAWVEKDVKAWIYGLTGPFERDGGFELQLLVRCATNEAVNPLQLTEALLRFSGVSAIREDIRVTRTEMYFLRDGKAVPIYDEI